MEKNEIILATIKRGVLEMISKTKADDAAYYREHEFHSTEFDKKIETLRQVMDLIFMAEIEQVLKEEEGDV